MDIIPGTHCAEALLSIHVPFREVVGVLMRELDLTAAEATAAVLAVQQHASPRGTSSQIDSPKKVVRSPAECRVGIVEATA